MINPIYVSRGQYDFFKKYTINTEKDGQMTFRLGGKNITVVLDEKANKFVSFSQELQEEINKFNIDTSTKILINLKIESLVHKHFI